MADFDLEAMLTSVQSLVAGLTGVQAVYIGVPESISSRVSAYITLGPASVQQHATQLSRWEPQVMVTFAYRVVGAEQTAEMTIARLVKALTLAVLADRTLGGVTHKADLDTSAASLPRYTAVAGSEFREYPVTITGSQDHPTP